VKLRKRSETPWFKDFLTSYSTDTFLVNQSMIKALFVTGCSVEERGGWSMKHVGESGEIERGIW